MTWIRTIPPEQADEPLRSAREAQRVMYPPNRVAPQWLATKPRTGRFPTALQSPGQGKFSRSWFPNTRRIRRRLTFPGPMFGITAKLTGVCASTGSVWNSTAGLADS